jgi:hypothetical protein
VLNVTELVEELHEETAWQETPTVLNLDDYQKMVMRAIRKFFVDINHPAEYDQNLYIIDDDAIFYDRDFMVDEVEYILCLCKIGFFQRVQTDVNNMFSYTTNALTVANADKPYANLKNTLDDLYHERRVIFNKMVRYTLGET